MCSRKFILLSKKHSQTTIVHTGDLAHTKTELSPEYFHMASNFLKNLADIAPTIIILGNHDGNLTNENFTGESGSTWINEIYGDLKNLKGNAVGGNDTITGGNDGAKNHYIWRCS